MIKPGDFFLGIIDFLAFIVPGMVLYITMPFLPYYTIPEIIQIDLDADNSLIKIFIFMGLSYIFGHFIHHIGALIFNPLYNIIFYKFKARKYSKFIEETEKQINLFLPHHKSLDRVADAYIRNRRPEFIPELERHEAISKMFRGICLLCIYILLFFQGNISPAQNISLILLLILSFLRFSNQRWRHLLLSYEFFSFIASEENLNKRALK